MKSMSGKAKIDKDYANFTEEIQKAGQEELKKIRERIDAVKKEAEKTGESIERSIEKKPKK